MFSTELFTLPQTPVSSSPDLSQGRQHSTQVSTPETWEASLIPTFTLNSPLPNAWLLPPELLSTYPLPHPGPDHHYRFPGPQKQPPMVSAFTQSSPKQPTIHGQDGISEQCHLKDRPQAGAVCKPSSRVPGQ